MTSREPVPGFRNTYEDEERAASYAELEFPGTYHLAFRDLPEILERHLAASGRAPGPAGPPVALDFGCGAGRSSRFLRDLGFVVTGVDIAEPMLVRARERDPEGTYLHVADGALDPIPDASCDVVLAAFTFDNIPTARRKARALRELRRVLRPAGRVVVIVSSKELYTHDWASFVNTEFPENFAAGNGDSVWVRMTDVPDARPVHDVLWDDDAYRESFASATFEVEASYRPLGQADEPFEWVTETEIAPWVIWVLERGEEQGADR